MKGARDMTAGVVGPLESFIHPLDKSVSSESSPEKEEQQSLPQPRRTLT